MAQILCAIKGGEASYRTQDAAIALAKERGDELLFLYVVNTEFLDKTAHIYRRDVVTAEVRKMGEFLLDMARERARKQGVTAKVILRYGNLRAELKAIACDPNITAVVVGKPDSEESTFTLVELKALAAEIEAETGAKVYLL